MTKELLNEPERKGWIAIGKIGRPHGLRGAFFLSSPDKRTEWDDYPVILLRNKIGETIETKVVRSYLAGSMLALQVEAFVSREDVEERYGDEVFIHRTDIRMGDDDLLVADLKGMRVLTERGEIGLVVDVSDFGAQTNLEIELFESRKVIFFPLVDEFIRKIDPENNQIEIVYVPEFLEG